jgi:serine/threonine-protein kinase
VIYEMLTGQTPFDGDTPVAVVMKHIQEEPEPPSAINRSIPPTLEHIILKCLSKDPSQRYRDGDELAATLTNFLRSPVRRASGPEAVPGRGYGGDLYENPAQRPGGRSSGPRPGGYGDAGYGAAGPASGPRGGARPPMSVNGRPAQYGAGYDDQTYDGPSAYDNFGGGFNELGGAPVAAPTRPWEAAAGTQPRIGAPRRPGDEPEPRRNVGLIAAIIGAVAVVLLVGCVLVLALTGNLPGLGATSAPPQATVPVVHTFSMPDYVTTPTTCTEAKAAAEAKGLKANCMGKSDSAPKNQVIGQSPTAGSTVKAGDPVTLTFSSGLAPIIMPNVIGQQYSVAADQLTGDGLNVIPLTIASTKYNAGQVVKTSPVAGTSIQPGSDPALLQVTVYVSTGAPTPTPTATSAAVTPTVVATATCTPSGGPTATPGGTC